MITKNGIMYQSRFIINLHNLIALWPLELFYIVSLNIFCQKYWLIIFSDKLKAQLTESSLYFSSPSRRQLMRSLERDTTITRYGYTSHSYLRKYPIWNLCNFGDKACSDTAFQRLFLLHYIVPRF